MQFKKKLCNKTKLYYCFLELKFKTYFYKNMSLTHVDNIEPDINQTLLTNSLATSPSSPHAFSNWKHLNLNKIDKRWPHTNKDSLQNLLTFIKANYKQEKSFERKRFILSVIKIFAHASILVNVLIIFIWYYTKCASSKKPNIDHDNKYMSNFTSTINTNETIYLRIQFCSSLYEDSYYLNREHFTVLAHCFEYFISECSNYFYYLFTFHQNNSVLG